MSAKGAWGNGEGKGKGGGKGGKMAAMMELLQYMFVPGAADSGTTAPVQNWKGELITAYQRSSPTGQPKDDIKFEVNLLEVEGSKKPSYQAVVAISGKTFTGEPAAGKKAAEHNASKLALEDLFPDHQVQGGGWGEQKKAAAGGTKRKATIEDQAPKSQLSAGVNLLVGRLLTKDDITYQYAEVAGQTGKFTATVTIAATGVSFSTTEAETSRKAAENAAAVVALQKLEAQLEPLREEHKAKKAKKNKEGIEKMKEQTLAKKEAKKAAA